MTYRVSYPYQSIFRGCRSRFEKTTNPIFFQMLSGHRLLVWRIMVILYGGNCLKVHNSHPGIKFHNFYGCLNSEVYRNWLLRECAENYPVQTMGDWDYADCQVCWSYNRCLVKTCWLSESSLYLQTRYDFFAKRNYQLKKSQNERRPSIKLLLNPGFADLSDNDIGCHFLLSLNLC